MFVMGPNRARVLIIGLLFLAGCGRVTQTTAQDLAGTFSNPIITGFAPDPSITRVGDDFYLVNSTFEYFPGVPVYHSRDLINWELIGYALHETSQAELGGISSSGGIHAATIRFHDGRYYVITTNVVAGETVNFVVTAADPRGPWSDAHVLAGAPGIDPSLFFDDDGRAWYVGNHMPADPEFDGQAEIWLQELDLDAMQLTGERHYLWRGCCGGVWAEGPHIYKKDGYYYLLISEGGTAYEHALAVAISKEITGPYRNNPRNPVLSHRQLSYDHPITGVGHADLVELQDGRWYAVALGWRLVDGSHGILGRETFLLPVTWETEPYGWKQEKLTYPVFSPLTGKVELHYPVPVAGSVQQGAGAFADEFDGDDLDLQWNFRRAPSAPFHSLTEADGRLRLYLQPGAIAERAQYSLVGIRQRHFEFESITHMMFAPSAVNEEAGMAVIQNDKSAFLLTVSGGTDGNAIRLRYAQDGTVDTIAARPFAGDDVYLKISGDYLDYGFYYSVDGENWQVLQEGVDGAALSPANIAGFNYTGVYLGLFASSNGMPTDNHADFESFTYRPLAENRDDWFYRQEKRQHSE